MNGESRRKRTGRKLAGRIGIIAILLFLGLWIGGGPLLISTDPDVNAPLSAEPCQFAVARAEEAPAMEEAPSQEKTQPVQIEIPLPTVSIRTDEPLLSEPIPVVIDIQYCEEGGEQRQITTRATSRKSASGETVTLQLNAENAAAEIALPGLGTSNEWKLYLVQGEDVFSMMLAFQLWNESCQDPRLQIPAQYAELTVNDEYIGLCILRPKVPQAYRNQLNKPKVALNTDDLPRQEVPRTLYQQYAPENLMDMALYCQTTYAYPNIFEDTKFIKTAEDAYYVVPGKPEYIFGKFPHRYNYLSWSFSQRVITAHDFGLEGEQAKNFDETMAERWIEARQTNLSDSGIQSLLNQDMTALRDSGYAARNGILLWPYEDPDAVLLWPEPPAYGDRLEAQLTRLWQGIQARFQHLDAYYHVEDLALEGNNEGQGLQEVDSGAPQAEEGGNISLAAIDYDQYNGFQNIFLSWEQEGLSQQIKLYCRGLNAYAFLPAYALQENINFSFDFTEYALAIEGKDPADFLQENTLQSDKVYSLEVTYKIAGTEREKLTYAFQILPSSPVPTMFVETFNGTLDYIHLDKENYEPGSFLCVDENGKQDAAGEMKKFHKRGTTSSVTVQKSYTLVATSPVDLLGLGAAAKWCLVGAGVDPTQIRNAIAYSLAQEMELNFAVDYRYVDLYCNGEYCGLKLLVEPVEVGSHRVEEEQVDFLVKVDNVDLESNHYWAQDGRMVQVLYPADPARADLEELQRRTDQILDLVMDCDTAEKYEFLQQYLDMNSFAKKYIIDALVAECDRNAASTFYYWRDGIFYAGPLWDCDRGSGVEMNWRGNNPNLNSYYNGIAENLMLHSPEFRALIQEIAIEYEPAIRHFQTHVPELAERYDRSLQMTAIRFPEYNVLESQGLADFLDREANLAYLQSTLTARTELIWDTILHPENYHHLLIHFDETCWAGGGTKIYWLPKGESLSEEILQSLQTASQKQQVTYENGEAIWLDLPVSGDLRLKCFD
ncbi:MAG: CotH kinase family protein [Clostridia bacterium]|nr:CotH kinase family protein [Clostridia bacterium]